MSAQSVILAGRKFNEDLMSETIIVGPLIEAEDPVSLEMVKTIQEDQFGAASVKYPTLTVSERELPGAQVGIGDLLIKRPSSTPVSPVGHWFEVVASTVDESLVGRRYRIKAAPQAGRTTSHRYPVVEEN